MPIIKTNCRILNDNSALAAAPASSATKKLRRASRVAVECDQHPSFMLASDAFAAYERWVSHVVLPIAFQWIEEHEEEVYPRIPKALRDDVGVVIAAAFDEVKRCPYYREGEQAYAEYKAGTLKPIRDINPVWGRITKKLKNDAHSAYKAEKKLLKDTICL